MKQISILGCGWLGLPLAKSLIAKGYSVKGSTTSVEKMDVLKNTGIHPFQISLSEDKIVGKIDSFLENSEILIIDIPPKLRGDFKESFVDKIQNIIPFIEKSSVKKVIFVSSTSVYGDTSTMLTVTELDKSIPETESGKQLLESESLLLNNENFQSTIIRFGGLIGADRQPTRALSGRKNIENPDGPINFIHQDDCIGIIEAIVEKGLRQAQSDNWEWNQIFNGVAPFHPTRRNYYTNKAMELNLPLPEFEEDKPSFGKLVSGSKAELVLDYKFKKTTF